VNYIRVDDELSQSLVKGVTLGTIMPGAMTHKTLYLMNTGSVGDRVLDISLQSRSPIAQDTSEVLRTVSVPTVAPMRVEYGVKYMHARGPLPGLTDLRTYETDYWDDGEGGEALVQARIVCTGPWSLSVETARLVRKVSHFMPEPLNMAILMSSGRTVLIPGCSSALWMKMRMM
jgi:trafficking protein particle complex subunit 11